MHGLPFPRLLEVVLKLLHSPESLLRGCERLDDSARRVMYDEPTPAGI